MPIVPSVPKLYKLMAGLLSIPAPNADSEREFSMLRKIQTDERASLNHSTTVNLIKKATLISHNKV